MKIRPVTLDDCPKMTVLTRELGYPSNSEKVGEILQLVMGNANHEIFIAESDDNLAGYVHLVQSGSSDSDYILDIAALMVDKNFRSKGIGDALVQQAGKSASSKNVKHLRIRTNLITPLAYGFFEHRGFVNLESQELFVKEIE